jgi:hypothetical protein
VAGGNTGARARLDALKQKQAAGPLNRAEELSALTLGLELAATKTN